MIDGFSSPFSSKISDSKLSPATPSIEALKKTFWGLESHFWMQIMDGKYHQYGPMVFDEALHKGPKEPGFFNSLKNGCDFATEHLGEKPTVHFYKKLHKILCAHFKGEDTCTEMGKDQAGEFRSGFTASTPSLKSSFAPEAKNHYTTVYVYENEELRDFIKQENPERYKRICDGYEASKKWVENWEKTWTDKANLLNSYVEEICEELKIPKFVRIKVDNQLFRLDYASLSPEQHDEIAHLLFDRYNQKMADLNADLKIADSKEVISRIQDQKLTEIAHLFQMLDWLHPFIDGQGRTDLVLLSKLLTDEGFNPPILEEPYTSSWSTLDDWKEYLKQGMASWREVKQLH